MSNNHKIIAVNVDLIAMKTAKEIYSHFFPMQYRNEVDKACADIANRIRAATLAEIARLRRG